MDDMPLIDGACETVKHEMKKQEGGFLPAMMAPMPASLIALMNSSLIEPIATSIIAFRASSIIAFRDGKGQEGRFLPFLALPLMMKVLGKGVRRAGRGYISKTF